MLKRSVANMVSISLSALSPLEPVGIASEILVVVESMRTVVSVLAVVVVDTRAA